MKAKAILSLIICALFISVNSLFAQDPEESGQLAVGIQSEPDVQWAWGEVISVNPQAQTLNLKHLDYEADQEKELVISVDSLTTYENVASLSDIKPNDNLSIDYIVSADGKLIAKNLSLEKAETASAIVPLAKEAVIESNVQTQPATEEIPIQSVQ